MKRIHRYHPAALALLAVLLGSTGYAQTESPSAGGTKAAPQEAKPSATPAVQGGDKWQEGTACVSNNAPKCPAQFRGACRTGRADGCSHDSCTAAKEAARASLRNVVPEECYPYIQSTAPCKNGPGCKSKAKANSNDK